MTTMTTTADDVVLSIITLIAQDERIKRFAGTEHEGWAIEQAIGYYAPRLNEALAEAVRVEAGL